MFDKLKDMFNSNSPRGAGEYQSGRVGGLTDAEILSRWQTQTVDGRRVDIFHPAPVDSATKPDAAVLFLHGHGQVMLNENPVYSRLLLENNLIAVCPDGKRSWWLDLVCPEFDQLQTPQSWLIQTLLPFIEQQFGIATPRIAVSGVSMGGQGALQLAYRYASRFPVVAAISPAVDFHQLYGNGLPLDDIFPDIETCRQHTVVLNLHPLAWPRYQFFCCDPMDHDWYEGCARLAMKLSSSGILHERDLETSAGGHSWDYFNHMAAPVFQHIRKGLSGVI
ncbi:MAG: hypothetical protein KDA91_21465 [Planctomycetaceae bacterium]|nr:hypothetical protein [Planctomycetaceae bacterium]